MRWMLFILSASLCFGQAVNFGTLRIGTLGQLPPIPGHILSVAVETNGWVCRVEVELGTNVQFFNGFGTNNSLTGTNNLRLDMTSMGFDDNGNGIQVARSVYGTKLLRRPWPDDATIFDAITNGGGSGVTTLRIALSDYVFSRDSNITATLRGGAIVQTNTATECAAATAMSVTNLSTNDYFKVIAAWSWPGFQRITNATYPVRCLAFHQSAQQGRPVRAVKFWATDQGGNASTNWVTTPVIDSGMAEEMPVIEFVGTLDASGMTQGDIVTNNFAAYPWIGDSYHDTSATNSIGTNAILHELTASQYYLNDRLGTYGVSVAVVDCVNGVDATGVVVSNAFFNAASPPAPFLDIGAAHNAIVRSNGFWFGAAHTNAGAGLIYLTNGVYTVFQTTAIGVKPPTWVTLSAYPGVSRSSVIITNGATDTDLTDRVKVCNLTVTSLVSVTFQALDALWFDNCDMGSGAAGLLTYLTNYWFTHCVIRKLANLPSSQLAPPYFRGNEIRPESAMLQVTPLFVGNWQTSSVTSTFAIAAHGSSATAWRPRPSTIYAFNRMLCQTNTVGSAMTMSPYVTMNAVDYIGFAFVQNLWEALAENTPAFDVAGSSITTNLWNVLVWNNTTVGQKCNWGYIWSTVPREAYFTIDRKGNYWDEHNIKADNVNPGTNGANTGDWNILYSVGASGNAFPETINVGAPGSFLFEWPGLVGWQGPSTGTTNTWAKFIDRRAWSVTNNFGGGNYRLASDSPLFQLQSPWLLPFDIEGVTRGTNDPPGAYITTP